MYGFDFSKGGSIITVQSEYGSNYIAYLQVQAGSCVAVPAQFTLAVHTRGALDANRWQWEWACGFVVDVQSNIDS